MDNIDYHGAPPAPTPARLGRKEECVGLGHRSVDRAASPLSFVPERCQGGLPVPWRVQARGTILAEASVDSPRSHTGSSLSSLFDLFKKQLLRADHSPARALGNAEPLAMGLVGKC